MSSSHLYLYVTDKTKQAPTSESTSTSTPSKSVTQEPIEKVGFKKNALGRQTGVFQIVDDKDDRATSPSQTPPSSS